MERFERFRFSVPTVAFLGKAFIGTSVKFSRKARFRFRFRFLKKTVPAVPVPLSVPGKTVPTVPVSGSGSVPAPS